MRTVSATGSTVTITSLLILFLGATHLFALGSGEEETPEERLARAAALIEDRQYDESVEDIASAVESDEEYIEEAEALFRRIRNARQEWLEAGEEVLANLERLRDPDLEAADILSTAAETLASVRRMASVYPNPNPEDAAIIQDLNERVSLTVDQQRFRFIVETAASQIEVGEYVAAVQTYVEGVEQELGDLTAEQQAFVTQENGIDLQRGVFESQDRSLADQGFAQARESVRALSVGDATDSETPFVDLAPVARQEVSRLTATFSAGEFENADELIQGYLPTLRSVLDLYSALSGAASVIAEQEETNAQRLREDPDYEYDWHTRFVSDLVLGRRAQDGRLPEGILHAVEQVRAIVLDGPPEVTVEFASNNYRDVIDLLLAFPWEELESPQDDAAVRAHVEQVLPLLDTVETAALTSVEIINAADELGLAVSDLLESPAPAALALAPILSAVEEVPDPTRQVLLSDATLLLASVVDLQRVVPALESAFIAATPLASTTERDPLATQRQQIADPLAVLVARSAGWSNSPAALRELYTPRHGPYLDNLIGLTRAYETDVAAQIAEIDVDALEERLQALEQAVSEAQSDLSVTETVPGTDLEQPRPLSGQARDILLPVVGLDQQTGEIIFEDGSLSALRDDALSLAESLASEAVHISLDERVQQEEQTAREIAATVGSAASGLLSEAADLLGQALEQVSIAEESEADGRAVIGEISDLLGQANAAAQNGQIGDASELLGRAQRLLSSENPSVADAGDYFQTSLANWYRPEIEDFWSAQQVSLNSDIVQAQQEIVFVQVDQLSARAQDAIADREFADALGILEEAELIWTNVFPTTVNRTLTALLRQARTGFDQEASRVLREDMPGFSRLSRTLTNAYIAFDDAAYRDSRAALTVFFNEQPLNFEARLLEVRLALATAEGNADSIVNNLIDGALEAVDLTVDQLNEIDPYLISDAEANAALELEARLSAVREVVRETGSASAAVVQRITGLLELTDEVLRPPAILPDPPVDLLAEANRVLARADQFGDWATLPRAEQEQVLALVEQALQRVPGYGPAVQRWQRIVALIGGRQPLPAAGQAILEQAISLRNQRQVANALTLMEDYLAVNPNAVLNSEFNNLLNQLRSAQRGR